MRTVDRLSLGRRFTGGGLPRRHLGRLRRRHHGVAHGPERATTTCQLHMRHFREGDEIVVAPWRAGACPVIEDLVVDRSAFVASSRGRLRLRSRGQRSRRERSRRPQGRRRSSLRRRLLYRLQCLRCRLPPMPRQACSSWRPPRTPRRAGAAKGVVIPCPASGAASSTEVRNPHVG